MFEPLHHTPITQRQFQFRIFKGVLIIQAFMLLSLGVGIWGFEYFEGYTFIDALLHASMLLGGMGQINPIVTNDGKVFASVYALYSGLFVIASIGVLLAPVLHRILHKFHADK